MFLSYRDWSKIYQAEWLGVWAKFVYVGVGVYVLDLSFATPTCGQYL